MREIKFRGKTVSTNRWIHGHYALVEEDDLLYQMIFEKGVPHIVQRETISQWTGLHDKNGKEVYIKDIVERKEKTVNGNVEVLRGVVYQHESGRFRFEGKGAFETRVSRILYHNIRNTEVIGNIYENPELLEDNQ